MERPKSPTISNLNFSASQQYLIQYTAQKMKLSFNDFFSKSDQIRRKHLLNKSLMENFIFCAVISFELKTSI